MSPLKLACFWLTLIMCLFGWVENKAFFGIGTRIVGDQLLLKDALETGPTALDEVTSIAFNYDIPQPITYIEIFSEENVLAQVDFSYQHNLVKGTVSSSSNVTRHFIVLISIYGFNDTVLNLNPTYILNRDQHFKGTLQPILEEPEDSFEDYLDLNGESTELSITDEQIMNQLEEVYDDDDDMDEDSEEDYHHTDKVIEMGKRQQGDRVLHESFQISSTTSQEPTNHSLVFYYIDSAYITSVKIVVYDHLAEISSPDYKPPFVEYSHFSPSSLKAIVTDHKTTSLFAKIFVYGYEPKELPVDYVSFTAGLGRGLLGGFSTESPIMSSLQRLQILMKAQREGAGYNGHKESHYENDDIDNEPDSEQQIIERDAHNNVASFRASFFGSAAILLLLSHLVCIYY